ncbi:MAG: hypothetical protein II863_07020 [Kiritimatiellae bacterium]|nr:hypothetical protein [Kiritimatiellia bacterium]
MKMGEAATVSVLAIAVACAMPALSDIVLENDAFKLVVGDDARAKSLVVKATGEETLDNGEGLKYFETSLSADAVRTAFAKATVAQVAPAKE